MRESPGFNQAYPSRFRSTARVPIGSAGVDHDGYHLTECSRREMAIGSSSTQFPESPRTGASTSGCASSQWRWSGAPRAATSSASWQTKAAPTSGATSTATGARPWARFARWSAWAALRPSGSSAGGTTPGAASCCTSGTSCASPASSTRSRSPMTCHP